MESKHYATYSLSICLAFLGSPRGARRWILNTMFNLDSFREDLAAAFLPDTPV